MAAISLVALGFLRDFGCGGWDNRDAPAGCVNTAARADRILSGRTG